MSISPLLIATAVSRALTVGTQIVVGFHLTPGEFGEFILALSTCTIISLFQSGDLSRLALQDRVATARTAGQLRSFLLAGTLATSLVIVGVLVMAPQRFNVWFVAGLAVLPFLRVMGNTRVALLSAQGESSKIALASLVESMTRSGVSIGFASAGLGGWSLVFGEMSAMLASLLVLNHFCAGPRDGSPAVSPRVARGVAQVTLSSLFNLAERELPLFAAGMALQSADAGSFAFAQRIATQFIVIMLPIITVESIPRMLAAQGDGEGFRAVVQGEQRRIAWLGFALLLALGVVAPLVMYALWGGRWLGSVQVLPLLALATLFRVGYIFNRGVLESRGKMSTVLRLSVLDAALIVIAIATSLAVDGYLAMAFALLVEAGVMYVLSRAAADFGGKASPMQTGR